MVGDIFGRLRVRLVESRYVSNFEHEPPTLKCARPLPAARHVRFRPSVPNFDPGRRFLCLPAASAIGTHTLTSRPLCVYPPTPHSNCHLARLLSDLRTGSVPVIDCVRQFNTIYNPGLAMRFGCPRFTRLGYDLRAFDSTTWPISTRTPVSDPMPPPAHPISTESAAHATFRLCSQFPFHPAVYTRLRLQTTPT